MAGRPFLERDALIANFVASYRLEHGFAPTHREIQRVLKIKHLFSVQRSLQRLKANKKSRAATLPLLGSVAAGRPIEAIEDARPFEVPAWMLKAGQEYFLLKVRGDSMIEDGIFDEDLVLIRKQVHAKNGDTVVALINNEATLKRFYKKSDKVILKPANSELQPIEVSAGDFRIAGIYAGVLRSAE